MIEELDQIKELLKEEYSAYHNKLLSMKKQLREYEQKIREQEKFLSMLEQEREKKNDLFSIYNSEDTLSDRIKKESEKKKRIEEEFKNIEKEIDITTDKEEKFIDALKQFESFGFDESILIEEKLLDEITVALDKMIDSSSKDLKDLTKIVDEYIYLDPERVKIELQNYIKENKACLTKIKKLRKQM